MKRLISAVTIFLLMAFASFAMAASSIDSISIYESPNMRVLKLHCVSHTDGSFTALTELVDRAGTEYWVGGWVLTHAFAINGAANYPDTAGTISIYDALGQQIVGSTAGDTLTLSTSASGYALLSASRSAAQRPCAFKYYVTITDTQSGTATSVFDVYLFFMK